MKKKPEPLTHVLEFFRKDSAMVRLAALLIDRLAAPRLCMAIAFLLGTVLPFFF